MKRFTEIRYRTVEPGWFDKRRLRRQGGFWSLLAFGIGTAIAGEFSGWSAGLTLGGFGGLLVATIMATVMIVAFCLSQAELASMMPFTGGGYAYARTALGPAWGAFAAYTQVICYVLLAAVLCHQVDEQLGPLLQRGLGVPEAPAISLLLLYALFVAINIQGARFAFVAMIATTLAACLVLVGGLLSLQGSVASVGSVWLPEGLGGIAAAIPFAVWFYLGIEAVPLAAEESQRPKAQVPRALMAGVALLTLLAFAVLVVNSAVPPGARKIGESETPLLLAMDWLVIDEGRRMMFQVLALSGSIASFHAIVYVYGRALFAASRSGYLPPGLSTTHPSRGTPVRALVLGAGIGYLVALIIRIGDDAQFSQVLLNMSVFAALVSYIVQMVAYLVLVRAHPHLPRPFRSPAGATGAMTALIVALMALVMMFHTPQFRPGLYGVVVALAFGMAYYFLFARRQLVMSPEEAYARAAEGDHRVRALRAVDAPATEPLPKGTGP